MSPSPPFLAFAAGRQIAAGDLVTVAAAAKRASDEGADPLLFDTTNGRTVELDLRGRVADVLSRLTPDIAVEAPVRGRGRPRLGVVAREVTLLPRHWDWLSAQPGGASVALRKLVEAARREGADDERRRSARDAVYRLITTLAGDAPGYEAATRALFAGDRAGFAAAIAAWPADIAGAALALADPALERAP